MKCKDMHQNLVSLLYGELDPKESEQIQKHLKRCKPCRQGYEELQNTMDVLNQWDDIQPKTRHVFVHDTSSWWARQRAKIKQIGWGRGRRLVFGIPAVAVIALFFLAVLNLRINYDEGNWSVAVSLIPEKEPEINQEALFIDALEQTQKETLLLVSQMIKESEYRQSNENALLWTNVVHNFENRREQDLKMINNSLEGLQLSTEGKFYQTSYVLDNLIRLTSYNLENK